MSDISILLLAAGNASRMGGVAKQLLPWGKTTLLGHAIEEARKVADPVLVVLGARAREMERQVGDRAEILVNPDWELGMGTSISMGAQHLLKRDPKPKGILIMLVDQPFLDAAHLGALLAEFRRGHALVVGTSYQKGPGVPALFDASLAGELLGLEPGHGAKGIIEKYGHRALGINPKGREGDIDTLEAYQQALTRARGMRSK